MKGTAPAAHAAGAATRPLLDRTWADSVVAMQRQGQQHSSGGASGSSGGGGPGNLAHSDTGAGGGMPGVQGGFHAHSGSQYMHPAAGHMMGHSAPANMGHHQWYLCPCAARIRISSTRGIRALFLCFLLA